MEAFSSIQYKMCWVREHNGTEFLGCRYPRPLQSLADYRYSGGGVNNVKVLSEPKRVPLDKSEGVVKTEIS